MTTSTPATPADIANVRKSAETHRNYLAWLTVRLAKDPAAYASAAILELNWAASLLASEPIRED